MQDNIGFISTRFAGTDGVSLESDKWAQVFLERGYKSFWYAGRLDRPAACSHCVPEAFFGHPENVWINNCIWGKTARSPIISERIHAMAAYLKGTIYDFVDKFAVNIIVLQNVVTIPMHIPLGLALTEFLAETHIPAIAHHHDFYWERTRFSVNAVNDILDMCFPPRDHDLQHVVINQTAQEELARRKGLPSIQIPNVLDFDNPPPPPDAYTADIRAEIGLEPDDVIILQPTRIVPRKGIGHAINLVQMLGNPKYKLVVTHEAGDEGLEYAEMLKGFAKRSNVDIRFIATQIGESRQLSKEGKKIYTLWDLYPHAALVTYPSFYEGFGNAFLEALYFRKPILVNRYANFARDIEPKGFKVPIIEGYLTNETITEVRHILENPSYCQEMVEHNYQIAKKHYSYAVLRRSLNSLIINIKGIG